MIALEQKNNDSLSHLNQRFSVKYMKTEKCDSITRTNMQLLRSKPLPFTNQAYG